MALFRKADDPSLRMQRDLEAKLAEATARRDKNAERLRAAESKLAESRLRVEQLAVDDDVTALDGALRSRRECEDLVSALNGAAGRIAKEIAGIEAEIATVVDGRTRAATAKEIEGMVERWIEAEADTIRALQAQEAISREMSLICLDAHGTTAFLMAAREQLPPAGVVVVRTARQHAAAVLAGSGPATLAKPAPEPAKLKVIEPPKTNGVFLLKHVAYTLDGRVVRHPKMNDATLPLDLAAKAIRLGAACEMSDPRRRQYAGSFGGVWPIPAIEHCVILDDTKITTEPKSPVVPIRSSHVFEPHPNVGKPYSLQVPVTPVEPMAVGARKMEDEP